MRCEPGIVLHDFLNAPGGGKGIPFHGISWDLINGNIVHSHGLTKGRFPALIPSAQKWTIYWSM